MDRLADVDQTDIQNTLKDAGHVRDSDDYYKSETMDRLLEQNFK